METKRSEIDSFNIQGQIGEFASNRCLILKALGLQMGYGGIAQLGEHLLCKQGVSGSIPLISTIGLRKPNSRFALV